jgi:hypothetical protein
LQREGDSMPPFEIPEPNTFIPNIVFDLGLTPLQIAVMMTIVFRVFNYPNDPADLSIRSIAQDCNISSPAARKGIRELQERGLLYADHIVNASGQYAPLRFTLTLPGLPALPFSCDPYTDHDARTIHNVAMRAFVLQHEARCKYCMRAGTIDHDPDERAWARDHVLARSQGGNDDAGNVVLACTSCNAAKGARPADYLIERLRRVQ